MSLKPYKVIATVEYTQEIEAENLGDKRRPNIGTEDDGNPRRRG